MLISSSREDATTSPPPYPIETIIRQLMKGDNTMAEIIRTERQSLNHKWAKISAKTGDNATVTLDPKERALVFAMLSFASAFPNFLIEYQDDELDAVQAFLDGLVAKLA